MVTLEEGLGFMSAYQREQGARMLRETKHQVEKQLMYVNPVLQGQTGRIGLGHQKNREREQRAQQPTKGQAKPKEPTEPAERKSSSRIFAHTGPVTDLLVRRPFWLWGKGPWKEGEQAGTDTSGFRAGTGESSQPARGRPVNKSSTVLEVSELSSSIGASLARDELELHHYLSRARASFFFSSEVAYYCSAR
nr:hypothetical protein CFP56_76684 [Quercus suber]